MSFDLELINNDIRLGVDGKVRTVRDTPKLRQDVIKIILTPIGSVRAHPWYGSDISDEIIGRNLPKHIMNNQIVISLEEALANLKKLQIAQSIDQQVSLAEMIAAVGGITAERDVVDQRNIVVSVLVLSKRLTKVIEYFTLVS